MPEYKAPLRDMRFLVDEVFDFHAGYAAMGAVDASPDMVNAILEEGSKFCEQVIAPLMEEGRNSLADVGTHRHTGKTGQNRSYDGCSDNFRRNSGGRPGIADR